MKTKSIGRQLFAAVLSVGLMLPQTSMGANRKANQNNDDILPNISDNPTTNQPNQMPMKPQPRPNRPVIIQPVPVPLTPPVNNGTPGTPGSNDPWLPPPGSTGQDPICATSPWLPQCMSPCVQNPNLPQCRGSGTVYVPPAPGTPGPRDVNGRPVIYVATNIPPEYDCPLFENRPYEALNQAIDSLSYAMSTVPECQSQQATMDSVQKNNDAIKQAIIQLQAFMQNPQQASVNVGVMEQNVQIAIQAATNLGQIFSSNTLMSSQCGRQVMTGGKALLALNDILNNLAPYALMAVAINPGLGLAAKFAITGGAVATSAISSMVKMAEQGTVDMTNPEHRKAVLKNTCQYTKIARKVRFMQLAQSGQILEIDKELNDHMKTYKTRFERKSNELDEIIAYKESVERMAGGVELQIRKDIFELNALDMQLKEAASDDQYTCLIAAELVRRSARQDIAVFPMTVAVNFEQAITLSQVDPTQTQIIAAKKLNDISRQRIAALEPHVMADDGAAIKLCAQTARTWVTGLRNMVKITGQMVNSERVSVEQELTQNPEYATWRDQYRKVQDEQSTVNRVSRVMKELAKDNSVIDRSELDQRMSLLKSALFGTRGAWKWGHSPVQEWLEHTMRLHGYRIGSFQDNISRLQTAAYQLLDKGQIYGNPRDANYIKDQRLVEANKAAMTLEPITVDRVKPGTRGHEIACQMLESAWLDWSASLDHLNATLFMCDMIDAYIDNKIEAGLVKFCRGDIGLDGRQISPSTIIESQDKLTKVKRAFNLTYNEWAQKLGKKMQEIKCPLPPVSVMQ